MDAFLTRFTPQLSAGLPPDWIAKESLTLLAPNNRANVIASSETLPPDLSEMDSDDHAAAQGELLARDFPGYEEVDFGPTDQFLGGRTCLLRQFRWRPPDGPPVKQIQLYLVDRGRSYTATATVAAEDVAVYESLLFEVLRELRLSQTS